MTISNRLRCQSCGEHVTIAESTYPNTWNVTGCACMVKNVGTSTPREATATWNDGLQRLQDFYGAHVIPAAAFKPEPPKTDRYGYEID